MTFVIRATRGFCHPEQREGPAVRNAPPSQRGFFMGASIQSDAKLHGNVADAVVAPGGQSRVRHVLEIRQQLVASRRSKCKAGAGTRTELIMRAEIAVGIDPRLRKQLDAGSDLDERRREAVLEKRASQQRVT